MWSQSDENRQTQLKSVLWKHKKKINNCKGFLQPRGHRPLLLQNVRGEGRRDVSSASKLFHGAK